MRLAALAVAALAAAAPAAAGTSAVVLPSTRLGLSATPPLLAVTRLPEQRFPGAIGSRQRVVVGVAPDGDVRSVRVIHRLELSGLGDFIFAVGAPLADLRPVPGSRSEPGLRRDAILWQGFSPGSRELAADARLRVADAAPALPLRVSIAGTTLVLENVTPVRADAFGGDATAGELAKAARAARLAAATGGVADGLVVHVPAVTPRRVLVDAPLAVAGRFRGRSFRAVLGGGRPLRLVVPAGRDAEGFRVTARPFLPPAALAGSPSLERTVVALLRLARVRQYDAFLANPDPRGVVQAVYEYRPARAAAPAAQGPLTSGDDGLSPLGVAALAGLGLASLAGLVVLWARS